MLAIKLSAAPHREDEEGLKQCPENRQADSPVRPMLQLKGAEVNPTPTGI